MRSTLNLWALDKRQSGSSTPKAPGRSHSTLRAGVAVKIYPLEPLRDALRLPRVNLFVADDVGLGKTIEAGLIVRELLMPQKVRRVVICAPPSVVVQWRERMESRFGLGFVVLDREYVAACRRERGFGVNPWNTYQRFIASHALLRDESYAAPPSVVVPRGTLTRVSGRAFGASGPAATPSSAGRGASAGQAPRDHSSTTSASAPLAPQPSAYEPPEGAASSRRRS